MLEKRIKKMKKRIIAIIMTLCMSAFVYGCSQAPEESSVQNKTINVLAAASLTDVMHELELDYEADHPGIDLVFSFAGSGALQTQIEEGAPADIFISAETVVGCMSSSIPRVKFVPNSGIA